MTSSRPKPRSVFRRAERWLVGIVMGVLAFVIEKAVLRSIKKGATKPAPVAAAPFAKGSGTNLSV
ncbi:MAG TPA: hypothetical protein VH989_07045 [Actinomycetota bacterium]|jgi:hypothetical protein